MGEYIDFINNKNFNINDIELFAKKQNIPLFIVIGRLQNDGYINRNVHFPKTTIDTIYSGPHIQVANPLFQTSQRICDTNRSYDSIDLFEIPKNYLQRCNYSICG